jgi:Xaa-Pro aminopeptidase
MVAHSERRIEADEKVADVLRAAAAGGADGALLDDRDTVRWLLDGRGRPIDRGSQRSPYRLLLLGDARFLLCPDIETRRVSDEERPDELGYQLVDHPWADDADVVVQRLARGARLASDAGLAGPLRGARLRLRPLERERYRGLGADAAEAMTGALAQLRSEMREDDAAHVVVCEASRRGIFACVVLVAGEQRSLVHRHPLPTAERLGRQALVAATMERDGLHASLTRVVSFGPPPAALVERVEAAAAVDTALIDASVPGARLDVLLGVAQRAYAATGRPDEWRLHHQGGPTGYRPREALARPAERLALEDGMAVAWNPSVSGGAKSEDTILVTAGPPELLTATPALPTRVVAGRERPAIVELEP